MKSVLLLILCSTSVLSFSQSKLPLFLVGTWKVDNLEKYEHWDQLNHSTMKGFSYQIKNGQINVSEYLEIIQDNNGVNYTAAVRNQNQGKNITFKMIEAKDKIIFENLQHDFPKQIIYKKVSDNKVHICISDLQQKTLSYDMIKQGTYP